MRICRELSVYDKVFTHLWRNEKNNIVSVLRIELFSILKTILYSDVMAFLVSLCVKIALLL